MGFKRGRKRACPFFGESKPSQKLRFAYCKVNPRPKKSRKIYRSRKGISVEFKYVYIW